MTAQRYSTSKALRPFSLVVAAVIIACGVALASAAGHFDGFKAALLLLGALALQAGVNLINDYGDLHLVSRPSLKKRIVSNARLGAIALVLASLFGLPLLVDAPQDLFWLLLLGLAGALGYTLEPINYKRRGLGVLLVFWLMGPLMVAGCYLALAGHWPGISLLQAVPLSLLVSLLLLSNEIRDIDSDAKAGLKTLAVRIGLARAKQLYRGLLISCFTLQLLLALSFSLWGLLALLSASVAPALLTQLDHPTDGYRSLPPASAKLLGLFGLLQLPGLLL